MFFLGGKLFFFFWVLLTSTIFDTACSLLPYHILIFLLMFPRVASLKAGSKLHGVFHQWSSPRFTANIHLYCRESLLNKALFRSRGKQGDIRFWLAVVLSDLFMAIVVHWFHFGALGPSDGSNTANIYIIPCFFDVFFSCVCGVPGGSQETKPTKRIKHTKPLRYVSSMMGSPLTCVTFFGLFFYWVWRLKGITWHLAKAPGKIDIVSLWFFCFWGFFHKYCSCHMMKLGNVPLHVRVLLYCMYCFFRWSN